MDSRKTPVGKLESDEPCQSHRKDYVFFSTKGIEIWLGEGDPFQLQEWEAYQLRDGKAGEVRVVKAQSHWRITRHPQHPAYDRPSTIQIRVLDSGEKSVIAFHEEHLPSKKERVNRKTYYLGVIDEI